MKYQDLISAASDKYGVRADLIAGVIQHESNWNPDAVGDGGAARGLMQMHSAAALDVGAKWAELFDPEKAIDAGTHYLANMIKLAGGSECLGLAAYNQGPSLIHHPQSKEQLARGLAYADAVLSLIPKPTGEPS